MAQIKKIYSNFVLVRKTKPYEREEDAPVEINNSELSRLNFVELRTKLKLIPSLILPSSFYYYFNCSNTSRVLGLTNICSSFAHRLQNNNMTKRDRNNLPSTVNLNIVNTSSSNLVTIFTSFSSTKREILYNNNSAHNQFTSFSNYLPSSILPDPFINLTTVPSPLKFGDARMRINID